MIAARWEFETTAISERILAAKYGMSRSAMRGWIDKQGWKKAETLRSYAGEAGQKQFQRDVRAAIKRAYDQKLICALEVALVLPPAGKPTTPPKPGQRLDSTDAGAWELPADPPPASVAVTPAPAAKAAKTTPGAAATAEVVRFPGAYLPPPAAAKDLPTAFPTRSRTEMAAMRVHLASLRGELALQQVLQIKEHEDLVADYQHLLAVYLNPAKYVDVSDLDPEAAAQKLKDVQGQAGRVALPTERDTLGGAILAVSKALHAALASKRSAVGITPRQLGVPGEADDSEPRNEVKLDTAQLREMQGMMHLLKGDLQRANEPPRPPPPEPLDDMLPPA